MDNILKYANIQVNLETAFYQHNKQKTRKMNPSLARYLECMNVEYRS